MGIDAKTLGTLRAAAPTYLGDSFYLVRPVLLDDGAGATYPDPAGPQRIGPLLGTFRALNGRELVAAERLSQQGAYRLKTTTALADPDTGDPITIAENDQVEVLGGVYNVVWAPPIANLSLFCIVGLEEAPA